MLKSLRESTSKEVSNADLIAETGIDRSNISKILSSLEKEEKIQRRYEQVKRARFVWVSLTNSQSDKETNSHAKTTNSHVKTTNSHVKTTNSQFINENNELNEQNDHNEMTNSQSDKETNSHAKTTNSHFNEKNPGPTKTNNFSIPEHIKIAWEDLAPSIASAFSKRKWPTKHKMFTIFDNWMTKLMEGF